MLSLKRKYESVIIVSIKLSEESIKQVVDKFKSLIVKNATLIDFQEWGKRKLAYPVDHETEGYYVLFRFESEGEFPAELSRQYKIDAAVVRFMTVLVDDDVSVGRSSSSDDGVAAGDAKVDGSGGGGGAVASDDGGGLGEKIVSE